VAVVGERLDDVGSAPSNPTITESRTGTGSRRLLLGPRFIILLAG
jgi:hypothetical protein